MPISVTRTFRSTMSPDGSARPDAEAVATRTAPNPSVRLLHVLGYAGVSGQHAGQTGVERVVEQLLGGLEGFEQSVVYPQAGALLDGFRSSARAVLVREPAHRLDRGFVDALASFMRELDIEIVLSHGFIRTDWLTALACRRVDRAHVVRRAVPLADERLPWLRRKLYAIPDAWTLRRCAQVIACSATTRQRMIETQPIAARKITTIINGVRVPDVDAASAQRARETLGVAESAVLVGGIGQLIPRKRFADLIGALALVRARRPDEEIVCALVGRGPEHDMLVRLARELAVPLYTPGFLAEPWSTIASFDMAVLPSSAEGMPLSVLEAMALGVPTIATAVAGTPEVIEDGSSGLLYRPGDVAALAAHIEGLCASAAERTRMGKDAAKRVKTHFSLAATMRGFEQCLRRVVRR